MKKKIYKCSDLSCLLQGGIPFDAIIPENEPFDLVPCMHTLKTLYSDGKLHCICGKIFNAR